MKLIRCYIENFGKLKNQRIDFSSGCHCFCYENGWGKTTLAAFLTVMLYGFDNERSRDDYVNERKRYRPWQGGMYGGTLTFEVDGKEYTVERTFGQKEKEDTFLLREEDTYLESKQYSSNLGEELFHLDRYSFERTIFLSQKDCSTKTTDRIQARLGNLAEATDDMNQYEKAEERLRDLLNSMSPNRKTGSLYRLKEQIGDLEAELRRGNILEKELESLRKEKSQAEAAYTKYKEVQELLLNQQKQITLQEKRNSSHDMKDSIEGNRQFFLWMTAGFGIVAAGIFFLINFKEIFADYKGIGYGLFFFGLLIFAIALVRMKRQKPVCDCAKEQYDKQIAESIKKDRKEQTDTSLECQIEETQQRLRKIQVMIENTYKKIVHLEQRIKELTRKKEQLLEKEEQAACLREQYASEYLKYERLNMTKTYLTKARESYLAKYRSPLMQSFSKYYEMVSGEKAQAIRMDVNLNLTVQDLGIQREARYYSEGWKDLMGICMRMALVDVMYQKEKPFMILDDPFVNLDEEKGKSALAFLKELGKEYQILYFTCHKSRRMDV